MSGGDKCMYYNCTKNRKTSRNVFHTFPSNIDTAKEWIINSGK